MRNYIIPADVKKAKAPICSMFIKYFSYNISLKDINFNVIIMLVN